MDTSARKRTRKGQRRISLAADYRPFDGVPDEMVDAICELSGLPREVVEEDVRRVLLQFEEADILTWRE